MVPAIVPLALAGLTGASLLAKAIGNKWKDEGKFTQPAASTSLPVSPSPTATPAPIKDAVFTSSSEPQIVEPTPLKQAIAGPTPTLHPELQNKEVPYWNDIKEFYPGDENRAANVFKNESGLQANKFHINGKWQTGVVVKPEEVEAVKKAHPGWMVISSQEEWKALREQYPSIDVGITQLNTADAMNDYMEQQGLTYYDLMTAPDGGRNGLRVGADLLNGKIPYTAPGWQNWVAYNNMDESQR